MLLLEYLLAAGLAPDERTARGLIMRGDVLVDERPVTAPLQKLAAAATVRLRHDVSTDVSRGAAKLRPVAERCGLDCQNKVCLDLGVSTGGFTQVLLERGAARVYAVDVGYGIVAQQIRDDPKVVLLERTNARTLTAEAVPERVQVVVGDLSFISWSAVLPAILPLLALDAVLLLLIKPQFELAASNQAHLLEAGVLRDHAVERDCLLGLYNVWVNNHLTPELLLPAALTGAQGNQEYFVLLRPAPAISAERYAEIVSAGLREAGR